MKITNAQKFPYPILNADQTDVDKVFKVEFSLVANEKCPVKMIVQIDSEVILNEIKKGNIGVFIHMYSGNMPLRTLVDVTEHVGKGLVDLEIDENKFQRKIEITPLLIALNKFKFNYAHEMLADEDDITCIKGQKLGYNETIKLDINYKNLKPSDLFTVVKNEDPEYTNKITFENTVQYHMSPSEHTSFVELCGADEYRDIIQMPIYQSIYVKLLNHILDDRQNEETAGNVVDYMWYDYLEGAVNKLDYDIETYTSDEVSEIAYKLCSLSFDRLKKDLKEYNGRL